MSGLGDTELSPVEDIPIQKIKSGQLFSVKQLFPLKINVSPWRRLVAFIVLRGLSIGWFCLRRTYTHRRKLSYVLRI